MTPSRVSASILAERIGWVDALLAGIRALPLDSIDAFSADPRNSAAAESYVRRALEALLDLGRHVTSPDTLPSTASSAKPTRSVG